MKGKICGAIVVACLVLLFSIAGAIENGASLSVMLWSIPITFVLWVAGSVGNIFS